MLVYLQVAEQEEEDIALKDLKQEQFELVQSKATLFENFEQIKRKILNRM
jgi:hypothetical protein